MSSSGVAGGVHQNALNAPSLRAVPLYTGPSFGGYQYRSVPGICDVQCFNYHKLCGKNQPLPNANAVIVIEDIVSNHAARRGDAKVVADFEHVSFQALSGAIGWLAGGACSRLTSC